MGKCLAVVLAVAVVILTAELAATQSSGDTPSCASKLTGCLGYLNATTTPPASCCDPLREAVTNERECLCSIYNNPALVEAFRINITQALNLPRICDIDTGRSPDICKGRAASPSSPATPSGRSPPGRITGAGLVAFLLMLGAYCMLY